MPRMSRVIAALLRHGDYEQPKGVPSAHLPYPLTDEGREQAREAVGLLRTAATECDATFEPVLDCSHMLRAFETASLLCEGLADGADAAFRVEEFDALAERGLGAGANLTLAQIEAILDRDPRYEALPEGWKYESARRLPFQGAESLIEAGQRVARHVEARCVELERTDHTHQADPGGARIKVFVGHGGAFRHAAVHLGVLELSAVRGLSMHHCRPVLLERSDDAWRHVMGNWKVRASREAPVD